MLALIPTTDATDAATRRDPTRLRETLINDRMVETVTPVYVTTVIGGEKVEQPNGSIITLVSKRKLWTPEIPRNVQRMFRTGTGAL